VRGVFILYKFAWQTRVISANNAIYESSSIVGRPCDKYITTTTDRSA